MNNGVVRMRRELMIRLIRSFLAGTIEKDIDRIPYEIRPKGMDSVRCCIYKDRAIIKYRLMALLGASYEAETDESKTLKEYLNDALAEKKRPDKPITACGAGCSGCPDRKYFVTDNCRGCFARPCYYNCPVGAIRVENQHAVIDQTKCISCGKCMTLCPFHAITKTAVPCEDACPVGAIKKNSEGIAEIDFDKCIFCGKCFSNCPFSAIMERSELMNVLNEIKKGKEVVAIIAPSAQNQFPGTVGQLFSAVAKIGFKDVIEVALGAEMTTEHEAQEFQEKMIEGAKLVTSSCCTAYVEAAKKHAPELLPMVSTTPSPMLYAADIARKQYPDAQIVFIGPCIAKRYEVTLHPDKVDWVMTFEELGTVFAAMNIDVLAQAEWPIPRPAAATARNFAKSCGVTDAILKELEAHPELAKRGFKADVKFINGLTPKTVKMLQLYGKGKLPGNFLEVMACCGGCTGGPCSLTPAFNPDKKGV